MKIECSKCSSVYEVKASQIPAKGTYATCKKCQNRIPVNRPPEERNEKSNAFNNQPHPDELSLNKQETITQKSEDIVCSKCRQRQPSSYEKCFKCGFDFNANNRKADGNSSPHNLIERSFPILKQKKISLPVAGFIAVGLICVIGLFLFINKPFIIPVKNDSFTHVQYNQEFVSWLKNWHLKDYQDFGQHSPQWDSKVKEVLDRYAVYRLGLYDDLFAYELQDDLQEIIDIGCKDPEINYILGNIIFRRGNAVTAEPIVRAALIGLEQSGYPDYSRYFAANKLIKIYQELKYNNQQMFDSLYEKKMRYLARAAADDRFKNGNQRYYISDLYFQWKFLWDDHPRGLEKFMEEYELLENVDPWIDLMVRSKYHLTCGWDARGNGAASTVSQDGRKVFKSELEKASECLISAHKMHPEFPEAATQMIHIRMTEKGSSDEEEWFKRAVNAQFDYMRAYDMYLQALRPRWGGSHNAMLKFGTACLDTKRFDTKVPEVFLRSLREVCQDYDGGSRLEPFQQRGIYKKVQRYFEGVCNGPSETFDYFRARSSYALYAWACGEYDDAKEIMGGLGDDFVPEVTCDLYVTPEVFINDLARR